MPVLTVKIQKSFTARATGKRSGWSNVYHINTPATLDSPELLGNVMALVGFEQGVHLNLVNFMQATISTPEKEGRKGHPEALRVVPLAVVGNLPPATGVGDALSLDVAVGVTFAGTLGRGGLRKYRGFLTEQQVAGSSSGNWELTNSVFEAFNNSWAAYNALGTKPELVMLSWTSDTTYTTRPVTRMAVSKAMVARRYHDRKKKDANDDDSGIMGSLQNIVENAAGGFTSVAVWEAAKKAIASGLVQRAIAVLPALLVATQLPALPEGD